MTPAVIDGRVGVMWSTAFYILALGSPAWAAPDDARIALGITSEQDAGPSEWLLDFQSDGIMVEGKSDNSAAWLPFIVSWDFIEPPGSQKIVDRLELSLVDLNRQLEDGKVALDFRFLSGVADYEMAQLDATAFGGAVSMDVVGDYLRVGMGLDLRFRSRFVYWGLGRYHAVVGIPLFVTASSPEDVPWFAHGEFQIRPNPVAWGEENFFLDARARVRAGYAVVEGEDISLRPELRFDWLSDGLTYPGSGREKFSEWSLAVDVSLLF